MKSLETRILKRLEVATTPSVWRQYDAPKTLKELKQLKAKFGVSYFFDPKDAMAYAKGKGFKIVDRSKGPDAETGPQESDLEFFYEVTDKSGKTVGMISGFAKEGEAWICPTAQHYKRWENYSHTR